MDTKMVTQNDPDELHEQRWHAFWEKTHRDRLDGEGLVYFQWPEPVPGKENANKILKQEYIKYFQSLHLILYADEDALVLV